MIAIGFINLLKIYSSSTLWIAMFEIVVMYLLFWGLLH